MANLITELTPAEFDFDVFEGDDFLWERVLKSIDKAGVETEIPLASYGGEFEVVDAEGVRVFLVNTATAGYPTADGITLGVSDGSVVIYKQDIAPAGEHTYAFRLIAPDTNGSTNTICFGKYTIRKKIVTT